MSNFDNPTPLRIGATGTLNGWTVRVAGRMVMSMEDGGETYFWNEYYLLDASGNSATLVFEDTGDGAEWKLFRAFTPSQPLSVREASAKKVGDRVNLDGALLPITLVDQSRVAHIEGEAPEGVEVGDVANYFNVDTGTRMLVASWTGDEIEFYEGLDAPADSVADAFKIPRDAAPGTASYLAAAERNHGSASFSTSGSSGASGLFSKLILPVLGLASAFGTYSCFSSGSSTSRGFSNPPAKIAAAAFQLTTGAQGSLAQKHFVVDGQALVEVARRSGRHDRREYHLRGDTRDDVFLINGLSGGAKEWHLLRSVAVPAGLTPFDAAARRKGAPIAVEGRTLKINDLFLSKALSADGAGDSRPGQVQYGFVANDGAEWLVARWNEDRIQFLRGTAVPEADVMAALGRGTPKAK